MFLIIEELRQRVNLLKLLSFLKIIMYYEIRLYGYLMKNNIRIEIVMEKIVRSFIKSMLVGFILSSSIANAMEFAVVNVSNRLNKSIMVHITPADKEAAPGGTFENPVIKSRDVLGIRTLPGYKSYKVEVVDSETQQVIKQAVISDPLDNIKKLIISNKNGAVTIESEFKPSAGPVTPAGEKAVSLEIEKYNEFKKVHPAWFTEVEKLGSGYEQALARFLQGLISVPLMIKKYDRETDATMARFMVLAALAMHTNSVHHEVASIDVNFYDPVQIVVHPEKGIWEEKELHFDPRLYKIHLMPRDEDLIKFYDNLIKFILENDDLRRNICYFKVLPNDLEVLRSKDLPRIVLYIFSKKQGDAGIQESKDKTQQVLDRLYAKFKNVPGSGLVPAYNKKVTDLIFFTQGNRADKLHPDAENIFDVKEGMVYFLPGYQGSTVDFRLRNP